MKERGILFSAPMVRALLAGTKTQTRRAIKPAPDAMTPIGPVRFTEKDRRAGRLGVMIPCSYGMVGDRLWVRETHLENPVLGLIGGVVYRADGTANATGGLRWRPAIHMPRWASRITLELTEVRVERLREISEADARAEGCAASPTPDTYAGDRGRLVVDDAQTAKGSYAALWESINGAGSWDANPWVWALTFKGI